MQWHLKERHTISVQTPQTTTAFAQWPLWAPAELLLHGAAMVTLWWPHCSLIRMPSDDVCFEHAQNTHRRLAFYAIPQHLLAMPLPCCGDACDCTVCTLVFCIFLDAMRTLLWCYRGSRSYGDWGHGLKSHPTDWRSQGSNLWPLVYCTTPPFLLT